VTGKTEQPLRSGQIRIANKHYNNYELYITVGEEEDFLLVIDTSNNETPADTTDGVEDDVLEAVAHFIMIHYAEKVKMKKKKKKKKCKPTTGQYGLNAGLKKFGDKEETVVTKEPISLTVMIFLSRYMLIT
jgi:hypothetical protein